MDDNTIMPFGKFKGCKLANVPAYYLIYMYNTGVLYGELKIYVEENMNALETDMKFLKSKR